VITCVVTVQDSSSAYDFQAASELHCQVWAVSHSEAFHACCDTFLKVSKGAQKGTSVEVQQAASYRGSDSTKRESTGAQIVAARTSRASVGAVKPSLGGKRSASVANAVGSAAGSSAANRKVARR
jgi:hypothetical protein